MVELALRRRTIGNNGLYITLNKREPRSYLRRNLNAVLDAHERALGRTSGQTRDQAMVANERRSAGWDYPTPDMLRDLTSGRLPTLRIDALQLRLLSAKGSNTWRAHVVDSKEPDWLPGFSNAVRLPCLITVTVIVPATPQTAKRVIHVESLSATIVQHANTGAGDCFDVTPAKPFMIEIEKLFINVEQGSNGFRHWKRTTTAKYQLDVSIQCQDSEDHAELLSRLESREVEYYNGKPPSEGIVKATWDKLPDCPPTGHLITLRRAHGHKALEMNYGMDISMGWSRRRRSPLACYNMAENEQKRQLLTPSASNVSETMESKAISIKYDFAEGLETRRRFAHDLCCMWCGATAEFKLIDRLLLHYMTHHSHFKFEVVEMESSGEAQRYSITLSLADKPSSSNLSDNPGAEYSWTAPEKPFNIAKHVKGDERWVGGAQSKSAIRRGRPPKPKEAGMTEPTMIATRKRSALDEVPDLPTPRKRRFVVPDVPNVMFFHSTSKQPIRAGEIISESEDEAYECRLRQSQRARFAERGLSAVEIDFHEAFNLQIDVEQSGIRPLVRDALVRFNRKYNDQLQTGEWRPFWEAKLKHLRTHGIIDEATLNFVLPPGLAEKQRDSVKRPEQDKEVDGDGDTAMRDSEAHQQITNGYRSSRPIDNRRREADDAFYDDADLSDWETNFRSNGIAGLKRTGNGKFSRHTDDGPKPTQSPPNGTPAKKRSSKPHKWSGGGADKDIINSGRTQRAKASVSDSPSQSKVNGTRRDSSSVRSTPLRPVSSARGSGRYRPNGESGHDHGKAAGVAHRNIVCYRSDGTQPSIHGPGHTFKRDAVAKPAEDLVAADLDFAKYVKMLRRELLFDVRKDTLLWDSEHGEVEIADEEAWQEVLQSDEVLSTLRSITFKLKKRTDGTRPKQCYANGTL